MLPRKASLKCLITGLALLMLGACETGYAIPKSDVDVSQGVPADAQTTALAIVEMLSGRNPADTLRVRMAPGAKVQVTDPSLDYSDFKLTDHSLIRHGVRAKEPDKVITAGILKLADSNLWRTSIIYAAEYTFSADNIVISSVSSATLFAIKPEPIMYVVPRNSLAPSFDLANTSRDKLLERVRSSRIKLGAEPSGIRDYLVFVFLRDRVSPSSELTLKISITPFDLWGYKDSSSYMDFGGWRVGVLQGSFNITNPSLYIKAVFTPGDELSSFGRSQVIGLFSGVGGAE